MARCGTAGAGCGSPASATLPLEAARDVIRRNADPEEVELALDLATQAPPQPAYLMRAESRASEVSFDSDGPATPVKPSTAHLLRPVPLAGETHHRVIQVAGDTFVV